jgi:hypothetical protein
VALTGKAVVQELSKSFKALEVPDFTRRFVPKQHAGKLTEPEPFSLTTDSRHARYAAQLKAKKEADDKKTTEERCFKANPVRSDADLVSVGVTSVSKRPLTEPAPFKLMSEAKHEHASAQWSARVEKELEKEVSVVFERLHDLSLSVCLCCLPFCPAFFFDLAYARVYVIAATKVLLLPRPCGPQSGVGFLQGVHAFQVSEAAYGSQGCAAQRRPTQPKTPRALGKEGTATGAP